MWRPRARDILHAVSGGNSAPIPGVGSSFTEFGNAVSALARAAVNTQMPATVVAYRAPAGVAPNRLPAMVDVTVDFLTRRAINVAEDATENEIAISRADGWEAVGPYPQLVSVPVAYPGHDGMRSCGAILPGAHGWVYFVQRSIDDWMENGGPVDPVFDGQWHDLSDAIFVPGARYGAIAEDIDPAVDRVGSADGSAGMAIATLDKSIAVTTTGPTATIDAETLIALGAAAALGVARLTDTTAAAASMAAWVAAVQVVVAAAAVPFALPIPIPPTDFGVITSASAKVKAE